MKKIYLFVYLISILLIVSCEEWVETDVPANQIISEQVFEDAQTAYSALGGLYANLRDQSLLYGNNYGAGALLGAYAEEMDCYYADQNGYSDLYFNQQQPSNSIIEIIWNNTYQQIYMANAIIQAVDESEGLTEEDKNQIKGEALVLRSLLYFYLEQIFGEIPYTESLDYEYNRNLPKQSREALLEELSQDLNLASEILPDQYRGEGRVFVNRFVARLLLSKVYLLQENWQAAEQTAQLILNSPNYQFQNDVNEVFHNNGSHILWQMSPQNATDGTY